MMTNDKEINELLDSASPMCEVGRMTFNSEKRKPCPAHAVYLLGFGCVAHDRGEKRVLFCVSHRNMLRNMFSEKSADGHQFEIFFEQLIDKPPAE